MLFYFPRFTTCLNRLELRYTDTIHCFIVERKMNRLRKTDTLQQPTIWGVEHVSMKRLNESWKCEDELKLSSASCMSISQREKFNMCRTSLMLWLRCFFHSLCFSIAVTRYIYSDGNALAGSFVLGKSIQAGLIIYHAVNTKFKGEYKENLLFEASGI